MSVLSRYIALQFFRSTLMILVGLCLLFISFDLLANSVRVVQNSTDELKTLGHYVWLRVPGILVLVTPIAALLGTMLMMHKMVKNSEMIILGTMGLPIYRVIYILVPSALIFAIAQFAITEFAANPSAVQLRLWAEEDYNGDPPAPPKFHRTRWVKTGSYIVHSGVTSPNGEVLINPVFVRRNDTGKIEDYIRARRADYDGAQWILQGAYSDNSNLISEGLMIVQLDLEPEDFSVPAQEFNEIRFSELMSLEYSGLEGENTEKVYSLWFQRKLAEPLSTVLMALMAVPIGLFVARQYNAFFVGLAFLIGGFGFFIGERLLMLMGESLIFPSYVAVWSPHIIFGILGLGYIVYKQE